MGKAFENVESVQLVKLAIETIKERDIADRFDLKDYPGFLFYDANGKWEKYTGEFGDPRGMIDFLNKKAGIPPTPVPPLPSRTHQC